MFKRIYQKKHRWLLNIVKKGETNECYTTSCMSILQSHRVLVSTRARRYIHFFITLSYNDVSIEPLVRIRWSGAVYSSPAPERWAWSRLRSGWNGAVSAEPLVRSRLRSRWCGASSGAVGAEPAPEPLVRSETPITILCIKHKRVASLALVVVSCSL